MPAAHLHNPLDNTANVWFNPTKGPHMTNDQIINIAACHDCCAMRGEPCQWTRQADPSGKRKVARQSHPDRISRAEKIIKKPIDLAHKVG